MNKINELFSETALNMKPSKIRELMKFAATPDIISLAGGLPAPEEFAFDDIRNIINKWDNTKFTHALQYGPTPGYKPLIDILTSKMQNDKKIDINDQSLIVTTGAQQAIFIIARIFINKGDVILIEQPSFIGAMAAFLSNRAKLVGVPLEDDGVNLDCLKDILKKLKSEGKKVKFFYTIPNFQNPGGYTLSIEKRKKLYDLAIENDLMIIEDDPYGDLYFTDSFDNYYPVKSYGNEANIIYLGTFSKILCPGFRLGWMLGNTSIVDKASLAKESIDACSSSFGQVAAYDYLNEGLIDNYLIKMRKIYKNKKDFMISQLEKNMPGNIKFTNPEGGFFIYLNLPDELSADKIFKKAIEQKVAFVTGEPFHIDPEEGDKHIRLSYSNSTEDEIQKGIEIIGNSIKFFL